MALRKSELKELAAAMIAEMAPAKTEVLLTTGEEFEDDELDVARAFKRATALQRHAIRAIILSWEQKR